MHEVQIKLVGDEAVMRMLNDLPQTAQMQVLRPAMRQAMTSITSALRSEAPMETGLLKRAMGATPVKTYRNVLFATAGARRGFERAVEPGKKGGVRLVRPSPHFLIRGMYRDPTKYLHIVEGGRKAVSAINVKSLYSAQSGRFFGKSVAAARPQPFVEKTFDRVANSVVVVISDSVAQGVVDAAARLGSQRT